ncbi:MAG: prolipoprotein diacylglyceryl transferase [Thermodesulfobacteriota bacterium]
MSNPVFVLILAGVLLPAIVWLSRVLPGERWQFLASIPVGKGEEEARPGNWRGINLTWYGLLLAFGNLVGVAAFFLLLSAVGLEVRLSLALIAVIMAAAVAAAKTIARLVEGKANTFTVAGGAAAGLYLMPLVVWSMSGLLPQGVAPATWIMVAMAALAISYLLGEGIGRLACVSFGCCYGKPLTELGATASWFFSRFATTYRGDTKKIAYASGLTGVPVASIQALTAFLSVSVGLAAMYLFLEGWFSLAFLLSSLFAMGWRLLSERFRADYRGEGRLTAYQKMGICNLIFSLALFWLLPADHGPATRLADGLAALWDPGVLLFLQALWMGLFVYFGASRVTGASMRFHVRQGQV